MTLTDGPEAAAVSAAPEPSSPSARSIAAAWFSRGAGFVAGGLVVYGLVSGALLASNVILLAFISTLLASALTPIVDALRGRLPVARGAALLLVYLAFFGSVALIGLLVVPSAIGQVGDIVAAIPPALQRARDASQQLQPEPLRSSLGAIIGAVQAQIQPQGTPEPGQIISTGLVGLSVLIDITTVLTLVYFWMTERARLQRFVLSFAPADRRGGIREGWNAAELRFGNWVRGQLTLMGAVAVMTGIAYSVLGLPAALVLALLAGLLEVIPIIGPALGAVPAIIVALTLKPEVLPLVVIAYIAIQLIEGNVLVPIVMRNAVGVSPLLIILSLLAGAAIGGIVGALVAVPLVAAAEAILERLQDRDVPVTQDASAALTTSEPVAAGDPDPAPS